MKRIKLKRRKIYVWSGELRVVLLANSPLDATTKAIKRFGKNKSLDDFYLDERGFREGDDAQFFVPVEQALAKAGYVFDDPSGWSPLAEE